MACFDFPLAAHRIAVPQPIQSKHLAERLPPTTTIFGTVVWSIVSGGGTLPNNPSILGLEFFNQGLFVDPGANPGNLIVTNGGHGIVGR